MPISNRWSPLLRIMLNSVNFPSLFTFFYHLIKKYHISSPRQLIFATDSV